MNKKDEIINWIKDIYFTFSDFFEKNSTTYKEITLRKKLIAKIEAGEIISIGLKKNKNIKGAPQKVYTFVPVENNVIQMAIKDADISLHEIYNNSEEVMRIDGNNSADIISEPKKEVTNSSKIIA